MRVELESWLEGVERAGLVCPEYMRRLSSAGARAELFRVLCDVNGGSWLFSLCAKNGVVLPMDAFCEEFGNYLGGGRVMEYPGGYTSKMYCRADDEDVVADTTLVYLLECRDVHVSVPGNKYPSVILSNGSSADIVLGENARLNVDLYGDAAVNIVGDRTRVRITRR